MRARVAIGLLLLAGVALLLRVEGWREVFVGQGEVVLGAADASYHARRALYTLENFPSVLTFDRYLAHPDGSRVPMPPLYDWLLAAVTLALGGSLSVFERVLAWASPVLAALTLVPVYLATRTVAGAGVGLGAAAILAVLPIHVWYSRLGNPDHHAAVALLGAVLLAATLHLVRNVQQPGARAPVWGLALARAAMLLIWSGSLLYVGLVEGTLLLVGITSGSSRVLFAQARSAVGSVLLVAPFVAAGGEPVGGPFSAITLSWLHVSILVAAAGFAGAAGLAARHSLRSGLALGCGMAALGLLALLALPPVHEALQPGISFLAQSDRWNASEQTPVFAWAGSLEPVYSATRFYGHVLHVLPLAWLGLVVRMRRPDERWAAVALLCWSLLLGGLATRQYRFGGDLAPVAAIACALLLAQIRDWAVSRVPRLGPVWSGGAVLLAVVLLWSALAEFHAPGLRRLVRPETRPGRPADRTLWTHDGTVARFARMVRAATPETQGYFDPALRPEYGILCPPNLGHVMAYLGRRATPAGNFGPYVDRAKLAATKEFYNASSEDSALEVLAGLDVRYVVAAEYRRIPARTILHRLYRKDGRKLRHFRLITEGPKGARPLWKPLPDRSFVPYKLYEVVPGAVLEVHGPRAALAAAEIRIETPTGRRFTHRVVARSDDSGTARLRVPYPTLADAPTRALGPYRLRVGDVEWTADVPEEAVRNGTTIVVRGGAPAAASGGG